MAEPTSQPAESRPPEGIRVVKYHYIKSNNFRVMHIDGVMGGATPQGGINMALYSERFPIPIQAVHEMRDGVIIGQPVESIARDGIVREVESAVVVSLDVAKMLVKWLDASIKKIEQELAK